MPPEEKPRVSAAPSSSVLDGNSSSTLDDLGNSPPSSALDGLAQALDSVAPGGSTLSSAHDRYSALGFALHTSSLGLVLVELRGSALNGLDCSVINSLGRYSMTSFALVDLVLSSELNDLGSMLN